MPPFLQSRQTKLDEFVCNNASSLNAATGRPVLARHLWPVLEPHAGAGGSRATPNTHMTLSSTSATIIGLSTPVLRLLADRKRTKLVHEKSAHGRVVKAADSKSVSERSAGSNPAVHVKPFLIFPPSFCPRLPPLFCSSMSRHRRRDAGCFMKYPRTSPKNSTTVLKRCPRTEDRS